MSSIRIGVWVQGGLPAPVAAELAERVEQAGVDAFWAAEGIVARDAFVTLSAAAVKTSRVELGTGVVNPFTRHPAQLAASFATLDELSEGRAVCGLGIGARDLLEPLGMDVSKPLTTAREMIEIVRRLLAREAVTLEGKKFSLDGVGLGLVPPREEIPIFLAAAGPKMSELAGAEADGIYALYGTREYITRIVDLANQGRSGERPFRVACPVVMAADEDREAARKRVKAAIGLMLTEPYGEEFLKANGLDPELAGRIRDGFATGGIRGLRDAVDGSIVDSLTIAGDVGECVERFEEMISWGVTEPQALLTGPDPEPVLRVLSTLREAVA
ncbi:MAG TPA: LLM class flavin-dependent oxidoreductase [Solirubrobacterales bacterium]|nr:LLM class flavin-dependent oxidoreductase [Solirubrobacterales bacterium]